MAPERCTVEALARLPNGLTVLVGLAWLPDGAEPVPDARARRVGVVAAPTCERWPDEADAPLRRMATLLA